MKHTHTMRMSWWRRPRVIHLGKGAVMVSHGVKEDLTGHVAFIPARTPGAIGAEPDIAKLFKGKRQDTILRFESVSDLDRFASRLNELRAAMVGQSQRAYQRALSKAPSTPAEEA